MANDWQAPRFDLEEPAALAVPASSRDGLRKLGYALAAMAAVGVVKIGLWAAWQQFAPPRGRVVRAVPGGPGQPIQVDERHIEERIENGIVIRRVVRRHRFHGPRHAAPVFQPGDLRRAHDQHIQAARERMDQQRREFDKWRDQQHAAHREWVRQQSQDAQRRHAEAVERLNDRPVGFGLPEEP